MAWEAAFVRLAAGNLTAMCEAAGLRLSYSAERSVEDELSRESSTDARTVLLSYLAMLMCAPSPMLCKHIVLACVCKHSCVGQLQWCSVLSTSPRTASLTLLARVMPRYIAVALSSLPRGAPWQAMLVQSRLGLGIGGVAIVAASVTVALGEHPVMTDTCLQ